MPRPCPPSAPAARARRRPSPRPGALALVALTLAATAGCAQAVSVAVAPDATNPVCARVVLALPPELADAQRVDTTSQATAAWGDAAAPIVLRCGVTPLGPTTEKCVTATDAAGVSVDWVAVEGPAGADGGARWTFTTYGREPAVEVTVPPEITTNRSTSFLVDLGPAIAKTKSLRTCV